MSPTPLVDQFINVAQSVPAFFGGVSRDPDRCSIIFLYDNRKAVVVDGVPFVEGTRRPVLGDLVELFADQRFEGHLPHACMFIAQASSPTVKVPLGPELPALSFCTVQTDGHMVVGALDPFTYEEYGRKQFTAETLQYDTVLGDMWQALTALMDRAAGDA